MKSLSEKFRLGLYGVIVGDALGNPAQFQHRAAVRENPITDMVAGGVFRTPKGTWTDDSSMTICLAESIGRLQKLDYEDIMNNFVYWYDGNQFTPAYKAFDIGRTTSETIEKYMVSKKPLECGGRSFDENGNGALMRILPAAFYIYKIYGKNALDKDNPDSEKAFEELHNMTALTHGHAVSLIACDIYCAMIIQMTGGMDAANGAMKLEVLTKALSQVTDYAQKHPEYAEFLGLFSRIFSIKFKDLLDTEIRSSGYVLDSLEAAIWCFLTEENYHDCVLKAVNLGHDADTIADITGGLTSVFYDEVPQKWIDDLRGKDWITDAEEKFISFLNK